MAQENLYRELIFNNNGLKDPDEEVANPVNQGSIFDRLVGPAPADENPFYYQEPEYVEEPTPEPASQPAPATQSAPPAETVEPTTVESTATQTETTGTGQKQPAPKPVEPLNFNVAEPTDDVFSRRVEANRADDETEFYKGPRLFGFDSLSDLADAAMNIGVQTASAESTPPVTENVFSRIPGARYSGDYPAYTGDWNTSPSAYDASRAQYRGRELMQPMPEPTDVNPYPWRPAETPPVSPNVLDISSNGIPADIQDSMNEFKNLPDVQMISKPAGFDNPLWKEVYDEYYNLGLKEGKNQQKALSDAIGMANLEYELATKNVNNYGKPLSESPFMQLLVQAMNTDMSKSPTTPIIFEAVTKIPQIAENLYDAGIERQYREWAERYNTEHPENYDPKLGGPSQEFAGWYQYDPRNPVNPGASGYREWRENRNDTLQSEAQQRAYDLRVEREARRQDEMNYDPSVRNLLSGQAPETYTGSPNDISASTQNLLQEQSERDEQARIEQTRRNLARQRQAEDLQAGLLEGSRLLDNPFARDAFDMLGNVSDIGKRLDMTRDIARDWSRQDLEARSKAGYQTFNYEDAINGQLDDDYAVPQVLTDEYGNTEYNGALNHLLNAYDIQYDANGNPITDEDGNVQKNYHYGDAHQLLALWARPDYINNPAAGLPQGDGAGFRELNLPEDVLNSGILASSQFTSADVARNGENVEYVDISKEDYDRLFDLFVGANPALRVLMDAGLLTDEDIAKFFFKMPRTEASKPRGSGGYGGGGRYYGGGGGYIGGGSYKPSVNLPTPTTAKQQQNRIYNIMKNWSF